jgi:flagellar hook-basal body complex protein FliE
MSELAPIAPIASIAAQQMAAVLPPDEVAPPLLRQATSSAAGFGELFNQGLSQVNEQLLASQVDLQNLATGEVQNLHQVMIRLEESRLNFQLMMQVRGRLLEAYQDIMKMQV